MKTNNNTSYTVKTEKGLLIHRDTVTGRFYSTKNDGSLFEHTEKLDIEYLTPLLNRLREYDRRK